ncbi:VCBS domain-containing protein [Bradyrhizobium sp. WSM 1738]|uniref:VCBS domain-containing protein n=1 Tax=Bradyrhizobium hereditatis TaxID=2821405 RepID=UPI001CE28BB8|nr:VCBS domain-containing protein [Bradyrhizobium hereditatis]MCA6115414.1 VCBS domain-containing protein [Bradyrhizobium hereditatis]
MNYAGKFGSGGLDPISGVDADLGPLLSPHGHLSSPSKFHVDKVSTQAPSDAIVISDAHLLFHGEFKRTGVDLILTSPDREVVLRDYFKGEKRAALASPDGAHLTGDIVNALAGHTQLAQADGSASVAPAIIGHVTKLSGNATAIRNGVAIILNQGDTVHKGDVVQSGSDSTLGITFIDGTVFGLASNARMVLNEMVYDPNGSDNKSLLSLVQGTISFVAGATAKKGDMKVDTPVATMGIRGTAVLVEIDFEVPGSGIAPPAKFQVLVEPDGTTGSYILFDKTTLTPIATVNRAGTQTIINGQGAVSFQSSVQLSPDAQKIISDVFSLKFSDLNNPNTKLTTNFTDSIVPETVFLKLASNEFIPVTLQFVNIPERVAVAPDPAPVERLQHIPGPPLAAAFGGATTERVDVTASSAINSISGVVNYLDINVGDTPSVSAQFSSFTYQDAQGADVTATLTTQQEAAIKAVEVPLVVAQDPNGKNFGTATWTYNVPDGAFDFLAAGETLQLTYMARVDNNYAPNNETAFVPFTIVVTGTNDKPTLSATGGAITERIGTGNTAIDTVSGTITFADVDLTDRPIVSAAISTTDPFRYYDAEGNDITATLTPEQLAAILAVEVPLSVAQASGNTNTGSATWTYSIEDSKFDFIAEGETLTLNYVAQVDDGHGGVVSTPITVTIKGADVVVVGTNDVPTITTTSYAFAELSNVNQPNPTGSNTLHVASGTISFTDVDLTDRPVASAAFSSFSYLNASSVDITSQLTAKQLAAIAAVDEPLTVVQVAGNTNNGSASWSYSAADGAFDFLADAEILTLTYTATVNDGHGGVVTKPITVTVTGSNDTVDITSDPQVAIIAEKANTHGSPAPDTASGAITFIDADLTDTHEVNIAGVSASGVTAGLANGSVQLSWLSLDPLSDATDGVQGVQNWSFSAPDSYFDYLADGETVTLTYMVEIDDHHGGLISQDVVITINGSNDAPEIVAIAQQGLTEPSDTAALTTTIPVTFTDLDLSDVGHTATITGAVASGVTAGLALDETALIALVAPGAVSKPAGSSDGSVNLSFSAASTAFDYLAKSEVLTLTYTVAINDGDGGITSETFTITIIGSNDAPVLTAAAPTLTTLTEDETVNAGQTVASFLGASIADVDHGALQGIAITATTRAHGHWEYSTDGSTFVAFPAVSVGSALLLAATDMVRFVPDGEHGGTDTFTYVAWDQTTGIHGTMADVSASGGSTGFSLTSDTATLTVMAVNDAPTAAAPAAHYATTEQTPLVISGTGLHVADIDGNGGTETVTLSVGEGILDVDLGGNAVSITGNGTSSVTITGLLDDIEALLAGENSGTISFTANSDTPSASTALTLSVSDGGNSGSGGSQTATATATIDITPVNDAPVTTDDVASIAGRTGSISGHLLANDTDAEHDTLSVSNVVNGVAASGYFTVDGTYGRVVIDQATGNYTYTLGVTTEQAAAVAALGQGLTAHDEFTYTASDGALGTNGHLKVTVTGVNQAPVLSAESIWVEESGDAAVITTLFDINLSDDDQASDVTITASALHGTLSPVDVGNVSEVNAQFANGIIYTPTDYNGDTKVNDIVTVTATDANGQSGILNFVFQQSGWGGATLDGTCEKDVIFATEGNDTLTGNAKADQFVFAPESQYDPSADVITDFTQGEDHIDLRAFAHFVNAENITAWLANPDHVTTSGDDKLIMLETGDTITLKGLHATTLHASDFIVSPYH